LLAILVAWNTFPLLNRHSVAVTDGWTHLLSQL